MDRVVVICTQSSDTLFIPIEEVLSHDHVVAYLRARLGEEFAYIDSCTVGSLRAGYADNPSLEGPIVDAAYEALDTL